MDPAIKHLESAADRRGFLRTMGGLGALSVLSGHASESIPARYAHRFQMFAEGTVDDFSLIWPMPEVPPLPAGTMFRLRAKFPIDGRDILEFQSFIAPVTNPSQPVWIATLLHLRVDKITISDTPTPNLGLSGVVIDNPPIDNPNHSPFGDLTGRVTMVYAGFDREGNDTTFSLIGGAAAGSHASAARTAQGYLHIRGSWNSF